MVSLPSPPSTLTVPTSVALTVNTSLPPARLATTLPEPVPLKVTVSLPAPPVSILSPPLPTFAVKATADAEAKFRVWLAELLFPEETILTIEPEPTSTKVTLPTAEFPFSVSVPFSPSPVTVSAVVAEKAEPIIVVGAPEADWSIVTMTDSRTPALAV